MYGLSNGMIVNDLELG